MSHVIKRRNNAAASDTQVESIGSVHVVSDEHPCPGINVRAQPCAFITKKSKVRSLIPSFYSCISNGSSNFQAKTKSHSISRKLTRDTKSGDTADDKFIAHFAAF